MASTFLGLAIATRGLNASQLGSATTTNNMSNINTTGYSRQVVSQAAVGPAAVYSSNLCGGGVEVTAVERVRSFRLDQKYWQANSAASTWEARSNYLEQIELVFGSTDTSDINTALNEFATALETLSTSPDDDSARAVVLQDAINYCQTLNEAADSLTALRNDINSDVKTTVDQINSYATQIAALNQQITTATANGASTNELEDQRDLLVDKLSALTSIEVKQADNGSYTITADGVSLVNGSRVKTLECYTVTDTDSDQYGMYGIRWSGGTEFDAGDSGALSGYLTLRDGASVDNKGISYYLDRLDDFARTFASAFNEGVDSGGYSGHVDGVGIDDAATTGIRFFTYDDLSSADFIASGSDTDAAYQKITAANISVSKDIQDDYKKIAVASADGEDGNNENISDLISICTDANLSGKSTATDLYNTIIATVSTDSAFSQTQHDRKSNVATYINTSRSSVSGVSSDEETVNMVTYQSAYAASAKMVSAWSEIYQITLDMVDD
ncbi:MAG: flagellar hook-associated protein FlgK [Sporomusaceae bacterium]|nr:flagellar hook-associated protein FlgK [Sporomusaceae bacterium]